MSARVTGLIRGFGRCSKSARYFTTPIYYVNAAPHIGHLYSSLIADAAQRWRKVHDKDSQVKFSTGTDEHGSKIQQAATKNGIPTRQYCDGISSQFRKLNDEFSIGYTDFIRTTDEDHKETVRKLWDILYKNGTIYPSSYEGWYCVQDETFLTESQLKTIDGRKFSIDTGHPVEWTQEQNYLFKLSRFKDDIKHWLNSDDVIRPKKFHKILLDMLDSQEEDLSISRPSSRVHWGIPVPGDNSQTVYVWLDALSNYLTAAKFGNDNEFGKVWPPDVQVIGKDILKFHGIYWPAFLMAANLEPPKSILCHSHWTVDGEKMSKSKHNVVCPFARAKVYTADGLRYFLLREGVAHSDGNYSDTKMIRILNSELADTLGNLLSRCTGVALNPRQVFPKMDESAFEKVASLDVTKQLIEKIELLPETCKSHYDDMNFYKAADAIIAALHSANLFFETAKPWELKKKEETREELNVVLHLTLETLRVSSILLQPLIPNMSKVLLDKIGISDDARYYSDTKQLSWRNADFKGNDLLADKVILFKRIIAEKELNTNINR